jgi:peptide/nickel transport system permease protein
MKKYILRRILITIPLVFIITVILFAFINLAPGDPVDAMFDPLELGEEAYSSVVDFEKAKEQAREALGLNKPIPLRYVHWLGRIVRGDLGRSYQSNRPVLDQIKERFWQTAELTWTALVLSTVLGTLFGVIAALRQYSLYDNVLSFVSLIGVAIPTFFSALAVLYIFALVLGWIPTFGMQEAGGAGGFDLLDNLHHLIAPALVLALDATAGNTRYARTAMLEVMRSDYVTTARAKGLAEQAVFGRHAFRNALLPLITINTMKLPFLFGGALIVEVLFSWPGMGRLGVEAAFNRDYSLLMGLGLIVATIVILANLLADVLYAYADPRIRVS